MLYIYIKSCYSTYIVNTLCPRVYQDTRRIKYLSYIINIENISEVLPLKI